MEKGREMIPTWKPTEQQKRVLEIAASPSSSDKVSEWMKKAEVEEKNWYNWIKHPPFVKWWSEEWEKVMRANVAYLDKVGMELAPVDFRYWEAMQKKYGGYQNTESGRMPTIIFNIPRPNEKQVIDGEVS